MSTWACHLEFGGRLAMINTLSSSLLFHYLSIVKAQKMSYLNLKDFSKLVSQLERYLKNFHQPGNVTKETPSLSLGIESALQT